MKFNEQFNKYMEEADIESLAKRDPREEYEDELDKKEAYKDSLLRRGEDEEDELISHLEKMSRVITSNEIDNEFVNIANKVLGLLKGVDPYSKNPPQLSPKQRQAAREIAGIILNRSDLV